MSSTNSSDTTKLAATALVAGGLGALVSYYLSQRQRPPPSPRNALPPAPRTSFIFHDAVSDPTPTTSDAAVLFPHSHEERMRRRIAARMSIEEENSQPRRSVTVRVPATSANCGPGFDCIGLAVDLWTEVTVSRADRFEITAEGEGAEDMPKDETNYIVTGVKAAYDTAEKPMPPLKYHIVSRIPYARGLGSSSAAIVAGIIAGLVLAGHRLPVWGSESLLQIAASIEGHPDNVAPVSDSKCLLFRSEMTASSSFHSYLTFHISSSERSFTEAFKSESTTEHAGSQNASPPHPVYN
jgi:homoserine kinase